MFGTQAAGPGSDAVLHVIFVGCVIFMIFGHAPIIFPTFRGVPVNFQPVFYVHLALLHASLELRVIADYASLNTRVCGWTAERSGDSAVYWDDGI
jgi:hypothetical protein